MIGYWTIQSSYATFTVLCHLILYIYPSYNYKLDGNGPTSPAAQMLHIHIWYITVVLLLSSFYINNHHKNYNFVVLNCGYMVATQSVLFPSFKLCPPLMPGP